MKPIVAGLCFTHPLLHTLSQDYVTFKQRCDALGTVSALVINPDRTLTVVLVAGLPQPTGRE